MKTLLLSMSDVEQSLSMAEVIEAVEEGYLAYQSGKVDQPQIVSMEVPEEGGETDIKSCCNTLNRVMSVKVASLYEHNGKRNDLPKMVGTIILFDGTNGAPLCVMDGSLITGIRTGAAGAISSKFLARKDSKVAAVLGGGGQARMQIYGLREVMNIDTVRVYSPYEEELAAYKKDVEAKTGLQVTLCKSVAEAMENADIVISTTPSKAYLADRSLVRSGMHIVAVGADMPGKNEWDPEVFRGAKVVCDSVAQCLRQGETRNAVQKGVITEKDIYGEIGQILTGQLPGRTDAEEITIFDTTGMAIQDNVTAMKVYEIAKKKGLGSYFEFL